MDKKKSLLNVAVNLIFKVLLMFGAIVVKKIVIKYLGNDINGLNSLYLSIIGILSVAELGIGSSIIFCMYKPIVEGDKKKVSALYNLYKKMYYIITIVIFSLGIALMPFLHILTKGYANEHLSIYWTYFLMLISVVISYFYSSKTSLINAHKNNYITSTIHSVGMILQYLLQIIIVIITKSFVLYLVARIVSIIIQWVITEIISRNKYNEIIVTREKIDEETSKEVRKKVKAMIIHKVSSALVNTCDNIIISAFLGVVVLGKYSNYTTIIVAMSGVLALFFTPLTSVIGHFCVENDKKSTQQYFKFFNTINFILGIIFFVGYYSVIDEVVYICFGDDLELSRSITFVITFNYFLQYMRNSVLLFRDATGTFYHDRWKPLIEGVLNIILSILFVLIFPQELKVVGVIVATIITSLCICFTVEPYVLFKYSFNSYPNKFYFKYYFEVILFVLTLILTDFIRLDISSVYKSFFVNGMISVALTIIPICIIIKLDKDFKKCLKSFWKTKK